MHNFSQVFMDNLPEILRRLFLQIINPERNCLHFSCGLSTLNSVEISLLILEENENRREYATANQVSNMYRVVSSLQALLKNYF